MLPKMSYTLVARVLISTADVQHEPAMRDFGMTNLFVYEANAIRQGVYLVFHPLKPTAKVARFPATNNAH